ncbi:serine/threonine-protein kinase [Kriegella sp. LARHCF250]
MKVTLSSSVWLLGEALDADPSGFGKVYRAQDEHGRDAVAKFVPKAPGAERELLMGDILRASKARNVVPVWDSGEHEDQWVIVMPRAALSLAQHLAQAEGGALPSSEVIAILTDLAVALVDLAAAEPEIVHRDVKPQNVLRLDGRWCLCDFGIARYAEATTAVDTRKNVWTMPYAAPEQWRFERATSATDVYALGVTGYQFLTGVLPFPGPDFREQHLEQQPPALTVGTARLRTLIEECLWKAPAARPTPANLLARLAIVGEEPASPGAANLASVNQAEAERRSAELAAAAADNERRKARNRLYQVAEQSLAAIVDPLKEAIEVNAPVAQFERHGGYGHKGFVAELGDGRIGVVGPQEADWEGPFTVIASATITVNMPQGNRSGYQGRAHSLWYCDAHEAGRFAWYETAFMAVLSATRTVTPFALDPRAASGALSNAMTTEQVAWPFEELDRSDPTEFVDRWLNWFALAAKGQLAIPHNMPEKPVGGSWRK